MAKSILLINGPNLNLLGTREPGIYGSQNLAELEAACVSHAESLGLSLTAMQSNDEARIIDAIHDAKGKHDALIINPGAYSHTSIAIRDAISGISIPTYEVHLSNIHARESFRHNSYISGVSVAVICGLGAAGYLAAIDAVAAS